jgi:hypothetical protein
LVVPAEVIVPETSSVAVTEISAVLVHPFVVPVTVNVVETIGLTLAIPNELLGVDKTYCAGDQEYVVAPVAESDAVSPRSKRYSMQKLPILKLPHDGSIGQNSGRGDCTF